MVDVNLIKQLRDRTGAGIADCRGALEQAKGNLVKAEEILKKKGLEKADKKSDREIKAGMVHAYVHGSRVGALVEVGCETDFVAKTEEFKNLVHEIAMQVASMNPLDVDELLTQDYIRDPQVTISDLVKSAIAKLGENIKIVKIARFAI